MQAHTENQIEYRYLDSLSEDRAALVRRVAARFDAEHDFTFAESVVMLCFVGSQAHGTSIPNADPNGIDDLDMMAVLLPPSGYTLGLRTFDSWVDQWEELDVVAYSFRHFMSLLLKSNPNVLGTLWLRDQDFLVRTDIWRFVAGARHAFATKAAYAAFAGYANGQMQKMTSYTPAIDAQIRWLEETLEEAGWHLQDIMDKRQLPMPKGLDPDVANVRAVQLRSLRAKFHAAYMGDKRKRLVVKYGYDVKNGAHLVRLLRMCREFLDTGEMQVFRPDADELKAIKRGEWTLEQVKEHADSLFALCRAQYEMSTLPEKVDSALVSQAVADLTLLKYELDDVKRRTRGIAALDGLNSWDR